MILVGKILKFKELKTNNLSAKPLNLGQKRTKNDENADYQGYARPATATQ